MTELVIKIDWIWLLGIFGVLIGIAWRGSSRFTALETSLNWIKDEVTKLWAVTEGKARGILQTQSPITYTAKGSQLLEESGLKKHIDDNFAVITDTCSGCKTATSAYDIQEATFKFMETYRFPVKIENQMKTSAFNSGISIELLRRVAGIYFRDLILKDRNMDVKDLDQPQK